MGIRGLGGIILLGLRVWVELEKRGDRLQNNYSIMWN